MKVAWLLLPLLWVYGFGLALIAWVLDLLWTPVVWVARTARRQDQAPPRRDASVIVLNWNGRHFLEDLLPSLHIALQAAPGDHEVIVVDNGSTDDSVAWMQREHPWVKLVRVPENRFFIRGNLEGTKVASRDILVYLNNDMRVRSGFLRELLAPFGPSDLFATTAWMEMDGEHLETGHTRGQWRRGMHDLGHAKDATPGAALWAGGGSSAFDRKKYLAIGGFEELYDPCYCEDLSLSYQAWRRGWRVQFAPAAVVHHVRRGTSERVFGNRRVDRLDRRNRELFFWRSVTDPWMVFEHALFLPWNALKHGRRTGMPLQYQALLWALLRMPAALYQRERSRLHYRRSDREVLTLGNA